MPMDDISSTDGKLGKTPATLPSPSLDREWPPSAAKKRAAGRAVDELFKFCELPDTGDPEAFLAAAIGIAAQFPLEVPLIAFDPINGLPSRMRRPALCDIRSACEAAYDPIARRLEREKIAIEQAERRLALEGPRLTPEQIRKITAKLKTIDVGEEPDGDLKGHKRDDPSEKEKQQALDAEERTKSVKALEREWASLGHDTPYCSKTPGWHLAMSPSLVRLIQKMEEPK
jgi:hypothetical protein